MTIISFFLIICAFCYAIHELNKFMLWNSFRTIITNNHIKTSSTWYISNKYFERLFRTFISNDYFERFQCALKVNRELNKIRFSWFSNVVHIQKSMSIDCESKSTTNKTLLIFFINFYFKNNECKLINSFIKKRILISIIIDYDTMRRRKLWWFQITFFLYTWIIRKTKTNMRCKIDSIDFMTFSKMSNVMKIVFADFKSTSTTMRHNQLFQTNY